MSRRITWVPNARRGGITIWSGGDFRIFRVNGARIATGRDEYQLFTGERFVRAFLGIEAAKQYAQDCADGYESCASCAVEFPR